MGAGAAAAVVEPMRYRLVLPSPQLATYVRFYRVVGEGASVCAIHRAPCFPDGNVELVINVGDALERSDGEGSAWQRVRTGHLLAGPADRAAALQCRGRIAVVNVSFRPGGALPFLGVPAGEIAGRWLGLEDLWPQADVRRLGASSEQAPGSLVAAIEEALIRRLGNTSGPPAALRLALRLIDRARGRLAIARLVSLLGISERSLERLFHDHVGLSPKRYGRVVRFRHALRAIQDGAALSSAALVAGYYDQSHLTNEFRAIAGLAPTALLRAWRAGGFFQDGERDALAN